MDKSRDMSIDPMLRGDFSQFFRSDDQRSADCGKLEEEVRRAASVWASHYWADGFTSPLSDRTAANELARLKQRYDKDCRAKSAGGTAEPVRGSHEFASVSLPNSIFSTVAEVGAEWVYGSSTLTPWEAAIVREAKAMEQAAKELAMPALALSLLAFGALKALKTGDTSTIQRAWVMVR